MVEISEDKLIEMMKAVGKSVAEELKRPREEVSEWTVAEKPMEELIGEEKKADYDALITVPDEEVTAKKELQGFKTYTLLDNLFLKHNGDSLDGVPLEAQVGITGLAGSGKSILIEEMAVSVANAGKKVLLVSTEDVFKSEGKRFDLQARLMQKTDILKLDWSKVKNNLFVMDVINNPELREWKRFAEIYRYICEKESVVLSLIDSITMLEDYRGALKYRVMEISRFNQTHGITSLMVNQRTEEKWDSYSMAGGHAMAHNLDATILVDYGRTYYGDQIEQLGKRGTFARMVRIMDCRMCGFDRERIPVDITNQGFLRRITDGE